MATFESVYQRSCTSCGGRMSHRISQIQGRAGQLKEKTPDFFHGGSGHAKEIYYPPTGDRNLHAWECKPCGFKDEWMEDATQPLYAHGGFFRWLFFKS